MDRETRVDRHIYTGKQTGTQAGTPVFAVLSVCVMGGRSHVTAYPGLVCRLEKVECPVLVLHLTNAAPCVRW